MVRWVEKTFLGLLTGVICCCEPNQTDVPALNVDPDRIERVDPAVVHERVSQGDALLVCAYESDIAFRAARLDGAITMQEFRSRVPVLQPQQEIIFYCS